MKTTLALVTIVLSTAVLSTAAHGQMVKCVSKDGKVEYARDCPTGTTEQKLRSGGGSTTSSGTPPTGAAPAQPKTLAERDAEFKKRQIEQQEAQQKDAKKSAEAERKQTDCQQAQLYLKDLEGGARITRTDPKTGERVFLDDDARNGEITRARARIAEACK